MSPVIQVQVSDEVAERMVRKLELVNLYPEAACMAVLLRDRSDLRREVSEPGLQDGSRGGDDIGQSGAAQVNRASATASENVPGGDPCCPGSLTSRAGGDTSTIRAALTGLCVCRGDLDDVTAHSSPCLEGAVAALAARLEAADIRREEAEIGRYEAVNATARAVKLAEDSWAAAWAKAQREWQSNVTVKLPAAEARAVAAEAALGAAREALREAVVVLEVLTGQIQVHPYRELTRDFQTAIVKATHAVRAAVLAGGDNAELAADLAQADAELAAGTTRSLADVLAEIDETKDGGRRYPASSEKLVRDCFDYLPHRVAGPGERYGLLAAKLDEEVAEVRSAAIGSQEFVAELGDLVEVCYALGGREAVEAARVEKLERRGGFDRLLVMKLSDRTDQPAPAPTPEPPSEAKGPS